MLKTENLSVYYNDFLALESVSFSIGKGTMTGIIGPNGAGKSTLLKAMLHIVSHQGTVLIDHKESKKQLKKVAYVEQKAAIDYTFPIEVRECVSLGTYAEKKLFQRITDKEWAKVTEALKMVDLEEYAHEQIGALSGGQFQRVLIARCLVQNAEYIFLDEPFVGIDSVSERIIMRTLKQLKAEGKTILIVHHDLSKVSDYFDEVLIINKNLITHGSVTAVFTEENLQEAYGDTLFIGKGGGAT
ncbi:manganese ABC transporter ATP-binding protein [Enterococcus sp. JM4C]|uniref:metal ABC transporter ATP-binding protein n=1 Tax=Candidatus Enterococcus huntleyi TaxID=1857217 RepID=UPI00137A9A00|nr:metal ABC transporter ATP-binding protein [Enterococcus sp. JM4C]KAF1296026.1 manganese ABC transporter ATP-binding protein [Enterococcus sp. JM4C]